MQLNEFLEKFLLEYEQRKNAITELHKDEDDFSMADANVVATLVAIEFFPEALKNFAERICEKQRENCLKATENANSHLTYMNGINNAEQPKIEEL